MLTRTTTPTNLLDVMEELELLSVTVLDDGEWIKVTDRKTLYRAALTALLECAESEGFLVTREGDYSGEAITAVEIDDEPTICMNLDGGCTCEQCTAQITEALGM